MIADKRRTIEEALIRWREGAQDEWRINYYFDCEPLGIVRLFVLSYHNTRYWECRWLDVEPCPVLTELCELAVRRAQGEWHRPAGSAVEYEVGDDSAGD